MKIKNINFRNIWCSSGARSLFNQGYWYSLFLNYKNTTFVSKTTTFLATNGNMPIDSLGNPLELKPKCIHVDFVKGYVMNAVGLSNPGLASTLKKNIWQNYTEPFAISIMAKWEPEIQKIEYQLMWDLLSENKFQAPYAIEINLSCPNVSNHTEYDEIIKVLNDYYGNAPLILNFSVDFNAEMVAELSKHPNCGAISVANTIKYGQHPDINWSQIKPLSKFGGGGVSGKPLLPILLNNLDKLNSYKIQKPIIAGGGILSVSDAKKVFSVSDYVKAIKIGTVAMLRPWRVKSIIDYATNMVSPMGFEPI